MNVINRRLWGWAILVIASTGAVPAAHGESTKLEVILADAQYALNRYEELDNAGFCDTLPRDLRNSCTRARRAVDGNVQTTKAVLLRASKARNPSATDLLDIYSELVEISGRLADMGYDADALNPNQQVRQDVAHAVDKTRDLAAHVYGELRKRVDALENACPR